MATKAKTTSFLSLPGDMDEACEWIDGLPEDHEYTLDELDWLEDARRAASRLVAKIDLTHEGIDGKPAWKR